MQKLEFQSKAKNLYMLQNRLKNAEILPLLILTKEAVKTNLEEVLNLIESFCKSEGIQRLIIRSSSLSEDSKHTSNAGAFLSIADIVAHDKKAIIEALRKVADSMPNSNDEILIQPYLQHISLCGVGFSVDKDNFSPYYCIECDSSGSSSSITDGSSKEKISYFQYRDMPDFTQDGMSLDTNTWGLESKSCHVECSETSNIKSHQSLNDKIDSNKDISPFSKTQYDKNLDSINFAPLHPAPTQAAGNIESTPTEHTNKTANSSSCSMALEALAELEGRSYLSDNDYPSNSANRSNCIDKGEFLRNLDSTKRTKGGSAEVSLGNFAGCVDIATRSYLDDNDAVAISNSCKSGKETTQSNKNLESNNKRFKQIISLMQELESLLQYNFIDIEFAFAKPFSQDIKETSNRLDLKQDSIKQKDSTQECTKDSKNKLNDNETLYLLQVRPLVKSNINLFNALPQDALTRLQKRLTSFLKKTPNVLGDRAIFGVMPDWNPAEIIGLRPKRLALSLYKEIVTDNIWAYQRDNYGYKALHSHPLMHSFLGIPYIDVRASFNSFIPKDLDSKIASKLANYYLQRLDSNPQFHDKVEFEIVFSCYDFNTPNSLTTLLNHGFNSNEIKRLEFALLELTNQIINTKNGYYTKDLEKVAKLQDSFTKIKNSDYSLIDKIYWSLQECKRLGTLPFAGIARAGFVAVLMLNSLVSIGFLSEDEKNAFLHTLNTISKQLAESSMNLNAENKAAFLEKFGHLRAGSYDILSPRYDEDFERYFNLDKLHEIAQHTPFSLSTDRLEKLDRILKEHGLKIDSTEFFHFLKIAIEGREYAKFEFSKLLSYTLVLIGELGEHYGISKEDMAHLDIHDILSLYASLYSKSPKQKLLDSISRHKEEYNLTLAIKLPPLITTKEQIFAFQTQQVMPNFITQKSITALKALHTDSNLEGKIVLIYAADPGFDYLFTKNIAGFITCYGGANSHMAIRASEQNMPAVIGVGEEQYQKYCKAERIMIDCQSEQIICL